MEQTLIAACQERALFRAASSGLAGKLAVTADLLRDLLAEARISSQQSEGRERRCTGSGPRSG